MGEVASLFSCSEEVEIEKRNCKVSLMVSKFYLDKNCVQSVSQNKFVSNLTILW